MSREKSGQRERGKRQRQKEIKTERKKESAAMTAAPSGGTQLR